MSKKLIAAVILLIVTVIASLGTYTLVQALDPSNGGSGRTDLWPSWPFGGDPTPTPVPTYWWNPTPSPTPYNPLVTSTPQPTQNPTNQPTNQPTPTWFFGTPPPTQQPTQSPTQQPTQSPTQQPTAPPTQQPATSHAYIWQTLNIINSDGSSYWVNPPKPFGLAVLGSADGADYKLVSQMKNDVYMRVESTKTVTSWAFQAKERITLYTLSGTWLGDIVTPTTITGSGGSVVNNQNTWVCGSTIDNTYQLQQLILSKGQYGQQYFVITLSEVYLTVNYSDGTNTVLSVPSGEMENTLYWYVAITP